MRTISAKDLLYLYVNNSILIVDVRNKLEYAKKHIPRSFNIPLNSLTSQYLLYLNKDFTYYIICSKGEYSKKACYILEGKGFKVVNVYDGISNWKGPIESDRMFSY